MADKYHSYSEAEREALARERFGELMMASGQLDAAKTFLLLAWGQLAAAGVAKDAARIEAVIANLRQDIADVETAAQQFTTAWREVLDAIEVEYRDSAAEGKL